MQNSQFISEVTKNMDNLLFFAKIENHNSWPDDMNTLKDSLPLLKQAGILSNITGQFPHLFYKLYKHNILNKDEFYSSVFSYFIKSDINKSKSLVRPLSNLSFIFSIAGKALLDNSVENFSNIIKDGLDFSLNFYPQRELLEKDSIFSFSNSTIKDDLAAATFCHDEILKLVESSTTDKFISFLFIATMVLQANNDNFLKVFEDNIKNKEFSTFLLKNSDFFIKFNSTKPFELNKRASLILDILLFGLENGMESDVYRNIQNLKDCPCILTNLIIETNQKYSEEILAECLFLDIFSNNYGSNIDAIQLLVKYKKENNCESFHNLFLSVNQQAVNHLKEKGIDTTYENIPVVEHENENESNIFTILKNKRIPILGLEFLCFLKHGFCDNTPNLNLSLLQYSSQIYTKNGNTNELENFFRDFHDLGWFPKIQDILSKPDHLVIEQNEQVKDNIKIIMEYLILEKDTNYAITKKSAAKKF